MKRLNQKGFTLIELILVVAILGILAVSVAPQVGNIMANSQATTRDGTVGRIQDAINKFYAEQLSATGVGSFPTALDGGADATACDNAASDCFGDVLQQAIDSADWLRVNATTYQHVPTTTNITYTPATGLFR